MESIAVLALVCLTFQVQAASGSPATKPCPQDAVWDSHLGSCVSCSVCETYPNTPVCESCTSGREDPEPSPPQVSTGVCQNGYAWDSVQKKCFSCGVCDAYPDTPFCDQCADKTTTSGTKSPSCPDGTAWDGFLGRCVSCNVCETHPDTPVCRFCPTPRTDAPDGSRPDHNTVLVAVLTTAAIVLVMCLAVAVWVSRGPGRGVCRLCGHGQQRRQFPEVEPGKTVKGYKLTQVEDDSGCSSMGSSNTSIVLLTTDKVTVV
ncbi:uncharacterized protein LOC144872752 [Branchiostoma floridae x Branchiostoma japonicum]